MTTTDVNELTVMINSRELGVSTAGTLPSLILEKDYYEKGLTPSTRHIALPFL